MPVFTLRSLSRVYVGALRDARCPSLPGCLENSAETKENTDGMDHGSGSLCHVGDTDCI